MLTQAPPPVILSAAKNPRVADERFFAALRMTGGGDFVPLWKRRRTLCQSSISWRVLAMVWRSGRRGARGMGLGRRLDRLSTWVGDRSVAIRGRIWRMSAGILSATRVQNTWPRPRGGITGASSPILFISLTLILTSLNTASTTLPRARAAGRDTSSRD